eukprot:TRINITY_DN12117_c0_g1_i9.p1 TRINITY_DN12117_c0_g1~~TRINITY_DN12117_c0_g1_i9.p1  ORF type:complete len:460 (-),score=69.26 TRINITY_DN12117_c0_g1_i9:305-1684(-)
MVKQMSATRNAGRLGLAMLIVLQVGQHEMSFVRLRKADIHSVCSLRRTSSRRSGSSVGHLCGSFGSALLPHPSALEKTSQLVAKQAFAAGTSSGDAARSWREAHDAAKAYATALKGVIANATEVERKLNSLYSSATSIEEMYRDPAKDWKPPTNAFNRPRGPPEPIVVKPGEPIPKRDRPEMDPGAFDLLGAREAFARPPQEPFFPDVEKFPPILIGDFANGPIRGRYSSSTGRDSLGMPAQLTAGQLLDNVQADASATDEENELWMNALGALVQTLPPLYDRACESVVTIARAEEEAERRRDALVGDFRGRVLRQLKYAMEGMEAEELDRRLTILQTDPRLLRYLGLLERTSVRAEEAQKNIEKGQEAFSRAPPGSAEAARAEDYVQENYRKARQLDIRLSACAEAAEDLPSVVTHSQALCTTSAHLSLGLSQVVPRKKTAMVFVLLTAPRVMLETFM